VACGFQAEFVLCFNIGKRERYHANSLIGDDSSGNEFSDCVVYGSGWYAKGEKLPTPSNTRSDADWIMGPKAVVATADFRR
jgi:hypothetical protein